MQREIWSSWLTCTHMHTQEAIQREHLSSGRISTASSLFVCMYDFCQLIKNCFYLLFNTATFLLRKFTLHTALAVRSWLQTFQTKQRLAVLKLSVV